MALEGRIKDFGLADIFQLIHLQKKTGVLTVKNDRQKVTTLFEEGMVVGADTNDREPGDRMGELLVGTGKLTSAQLHEALKLQQQHGGKFGKILEGKGWIKKEELGKILQLQVQETIFRLFSWEEGHYAFEPKSVDYNREYINPINTEFVLMEGVRRIDEWPMIKKMIPSLDIVFEAALQDAARSQVRSQAGDKAGEMAIETSDSSSSGAIELTQEERQVLGLVDGIKDITTITDFSQRGEFETCKALAGLLRAGLIRVKETGAKGTPKTKAAIGTTSRMLFDTARQAARWAIYLTTTVVLAAFVTLAYQYRHNLLSSMSSAYDGFTEIKSTEARWALGTVRMQLLMYYLENHAYPKDLDTLVQQGYLSSKDILDPWGHALQFKLLDVGYTLSSSGRDESPGTEDYID